MIEAGAETHSQTLFGFGNPGEERKWIGHRAVEKIVGVQGFKNTTRKSTESINLST